MKKIRALFNIFLICASLSVSLPANAEEEALPDGTVAGLPDAITVMDDSGNAVNSTGEYFFEVTDMEPNVTYTKEIQIMNLREDEAYHIYFYAEPASKSGEIDLESTSTCVFLLDGKQIYEGLVNGDGDTDISKNPIDLGEFSPGDSATLTCEITWSGDLGDGTYVMDNGSRLVDADGTHIIREANGTSYISGQTEFRWIFYAVVDKEYEAPQTGIFSESMIRLYVALAILAVVIMALLVILKRRKKTKKCSIPPEQLNNYEC